MDATFWALISLILFMAIIFYMKVPGMITGSLDTRADRIRNELDEARRLREEAQQLLAEYQRKRKDAEKEASELIAAAEHEASGLVAEARQKTEDYVQTPHRHGGTERSRWRRPKLSTRCVNQAIDIAVSAAAETLIAEKADDEEDRVRIVQVSPSS